MVFRAAAVDSAAGVRPEVGKTLMLGKPEAPSLGVIKGSQYNEYGFTLDALTLNTSDFSNIRVTP